MGEGDYSKGPPPIPPPPTRPELPAPIDAEFSEIDDLLGPEPVPVAPININIGLTVGDTPESFEPENLAVRPLPPPPVERVIRDAPGARETQPPQDGLLRQPIAYDATPTRPATTPLMQSLYDELEKARARKALG
jgi:hypothetical protein